jgi:phage tail-like protein
VTRVDVNGTRFHLILGQPDWQACRQVVSSGDLDHAQWDDQARAMTLRPILSLFHPNRPTAALDPDQRRGAAVDAFGNRYWIGSDEQTLWLSGPAMRPRLFWQQGHTHSTPARGAFGPVEQAPQPPAQLAGLTVTAHHYLLVGNRSQPGVFIFDLRAGGEPLLLLFPSSVPFEPFDIAPAPDGGAWILDRVNSTFWGLDRQFRIISAPGTPAPGAGEPDTFRPVDGEPVVRPERRSRQGFSIAATDPLAIESLPDCSVLVLAPPPEPDAPSQIYRYRQGTQIGAPVPLASEMLVDEGQHIGEQQFGVVGYDMAFVPDEQAASSGSGMLSVVEADGKQAFAFALDYTPTEMHLMAQVDYLPLHAYGGRALVAAPGTGRHAFYDIAARERTRDSAVRWVALHPIEQPRYATSAELVLDAPGHAAATPAHFDGKERDCVWHRLFLDGCIPPETQIEVWSRASNSLETLERQPFLAEPALYLRQSGAELPFYQPFAQQNQGAPGTGTWETLFQAARGRYIQVRLVLRGNGHATPQIRALRLYYPRFSYPRRYLPAAYLDEPEAASFIERLLANQEGIYTEIEGKISLVSMLFDPRSAPPEALDWLAGWWGLLFDPLWQRIHGHAAHESAASQPATDRRRLFIRFVRTLYQWRGTVAGMRFALALLLEPCLEQTLQTFKAATVKLNPALRDELARLGLPYPTPVMSDAQLEDLLYDFVQSPQRPSKIRIVERFQTRNGRALAAGDTTGQGGHSGTEGSGEDAHRFSVLVPEQLTNEEEAMVERIVRLEKPAHTLFDIRRYFDYFRAGEARLGIDTVLGTESRFVAMVLDRTSLAEGYLAPHSPMGAPDRVVSDRDRAGLLPPL